MPGLASWISWKLGRCDGLQYVSLVNVDLSIDD